MPSKVHVYEFKTRQIRSECGGLIKLALLKGRRMPEHQLKLITRNTHPSTGGVKYKLD
jgi:hypothetical protein